MRNSKIEVRQEDGVWYYTVHASNGTQLVESRGYANRRNVLNAISAMQDAVYNAVVIDTVRPDLQVA